MSSPSHSSVGRLLSGNSATSSSKVHRRFFQVAGAGLALAAITRIINPRMSRPSSAGAGPVSQPRIAAIVSDETKSAAEGRRVPKGTVETTCFNRPFGTYCAARAHPALKRWAILVCPSGTGAELGLHEGGCRSNPNGIGRSCLPVTATFQSPEHQRVNRRVRAAR